MKLGTASRLVKNEREARVVAIRKVEEASAEDTELAYATHIQFNIIYIMRTRRIFLQVLGQSLLSLVDSAVDVPIAVASIAFTLFLGMLREIRWV